MFRPRNSEINKILKYFDYYNKTWKEKFINIQENLSENYKKYRDDYLKKRWQYLDNNKDIGLDIFLIILMKILYRKL